MAKIPWIDFAKAYPNARLVVGLMGDATGAPVRNAMIVLAKLVARQEAGDFSIGITRDSGITAVFCALADPLAAERVADALGARAIGREGQSHRTFDLDEEVLAEIRARVQRPTRIHQKRGRAPLTRLEA